MAQLLPMIINKHRISVNTRGLDHHSLWPLLCLTTAVLDATSVQMCRD